MNLQNEWYRLWNRNAQSDPAAAYAELLTAYNQSHRAYHNLDHIRDCLLQLKNCAVTPNDTDAVQLALWLHDVVYEIGAPDNEEQSAQWAATLLQYGIVSVESKQVESMQIESAQAETVRALILATKHHRSPIAVDAKLVVDIDLSILGRSPVEFAQYESRIRTEYQQMDEKQYRSGRAKILRGFLERKSIYFTDHFRAKYEEQARENLVESIVALEVKNYAG